MVFFCLERVVFASIPEKGNLDIIAHGSIIRVFAVCVKLAGSTAGALVVSQCVEPQLAG